MTITEIEAMLDVNGGTRRPKNRAAIVAALLGCTDQLGLTITDIRRITGLSDAVASVTIQQLKKCGRAFCLGVRKDMRYFPSQEAADLARPAYEAFMAGVVAERKAHDREMHRLYDQRYHERERAKRAANPQPRKKPGRKPNPDKAPKVKPALKPANTPNVVIKASSRAWWDKDAQPVITSNTKVTIAPTPVAPYRTNTYTD